MRMLCVTAVVWLIIVAPADAKRMHLHRPPPGGFQMRMTPFLIPLGGEREVCEYQTTPNRKAMDVAELQLRSTPGTHHFVLWEYLGQDRNPTDFWSGVSDAPGCVGLGPQDGFTTTANLFGMQVSPAQVRFPPGVAVHLEPHAVLYSNLHLHNFFPTPIMAEAVFNVIPARKGSVRHHAQSLTVGSYDIDIPPLGSASLTGQWHAPVALNIVQLSTHQHHRGTLVSVHQMDAAGNDMGELVASPDWQHATVRWFPHALRVDAGEGFRFTCDWTNPDDHPVRFGVTTDDEMCFMTGYFYLDDDSGHASGPGCLPQGAGLECFVPKLP
jgi:hypothetical protein